MNETFVLLQGSGFLPGTTLWTAVQEGRAQIEPTGIIKLSIQSSEFEAHEEIGICRSEGQLWRREPYGEERT